MNTITDEEIAEWERERGNGRTSAVGEYTPSEFWQLLDEVKSRRAEVRALQDRLDHVYGERNALVVAFAKSAIVAGWGAGRGYDGDLSKEWTPEWRHVVYVDLPNGQQVSWHMSPGEICLLEGLPEYQGEWDGKYTARDKSWCNFDISQQAKIKDQSRD